jgi:hypothetical protein
LLALEILVKPGGCLSKRRGAKEYITAKKDSNGKNNKEARVGYHSIPVKATLCDEFMMFMLYNQ